VMRNASGESSWRHSASDLVILRSVIGHLQLVLPHYTLV
jgi:hypothetical protein